MARKSQRKSDKYVKFSWESVHLQCEWNGCNYETEVLAVYLRHVDDHMHRVAVQPADNPCLWTGCESEPLMGSELHCHVMYHAFHTKLKSFGRSLLMRKNLPNCLLEDKTRNYIPEVPEKFRCQWRSCMDSFHSPESFYRHVDIHTEEFPKGNCPGRNAVCHWLDCGAIFVSLYKLKEHLRVHTQEKMISCHVCGSMFSSRTKLEDHVTRQNVAGVFSGKKSKALYQCEYCTKRTSTERLLRAHMRCHVNSYKCPYCNMTCTAPSSLKSHILYRHSKEKHFACPQCTYKSKTGGDLQKHMEQHTRREVHPCPGEGCTFKTPSEGALLHHMRRYHQGPSSYICHLCDNKFTRGAYLTKHLMKSHRLRWPEGHSRFRYTRQEDGVYRLQMVRYETVELSQHMQMIEEQKKKKGKVDRSQDSLGYSDDDDDDDPDDPDAINSDNMDPGSILPDDGVLSTPLVIYIPPTADIDNTIDAIKGQMTQAEPKKIQLVTTNSEGLTVLQTAEVIAEGESLCES